MEDFTNLDLKKKLLRKQMCFAKLTDEEIENLAALLVEKKYPAGTTIVTEGDIVDSVYLIVSGTADVRLLTVEGHTLKTHSVATLGPDKAIGLSDTGFYSLTGKRTATVVAITDMVLFYLSTAQFHGFALANSHVGEVMHRNAESLTEGKYE